MSEQQPTLLQRIGYLPAADQALVQRAQARAAALYGEKTRESGGLYVEHALAVAGILADWQAPAEILAAGLFHDLPDLSGEPQARIAAEFGPLAAGLVGEVARVSTFLPNYPLVSLAEFAEHEDDLVRLAWVKELLVHMPEAAVIKIADRLESFSSLAGLPAPRREQFASTTMNLFIPLANCLGMGEIQRRLEDAAFQALAGEEYERTRAAYTPAQCAAQLGTLGEELATLLGGRGLAVQVGPAPTSLFEIYRRLARARRKTRGPGPQTCETFYPLLVLCETQDACYQALGALHERWKPLSSSELRDHYSRPLPNGYRALHTRVTLPGGSPLRVILRDRASDTVARWGITARWRGVPPELLPDLSTRPAGGEEDGQARITVFTPRGRPLSLPVGATPIDFAYELHTEIGRHCIAARVNKQPAPLETALQSGDMVEILGSSSPVTPQQAWLEKARSKKARRDLRLRLITTLRGSQPIRASFSLQAAYRSACLRALSLAGDRLGDGLEEVRILHPAGQPFTLEMRLRAPAEKLDQVANRLRLLEGVTEPRWQAESGPATAPQPPANPHTLLPVSGEQFTGREEDLKELVAKLGELSPGSSVLVWGQRRIGKTSLLREFIRRYLASSPGFLAVYVDMQGMGGKTTLAFLRQVAARINQESGARLAVPSEEAFQADPLESFRAFLRALHAADRRRLVLVVDEFELLASLKAEHISVADLFTYLRGAIQQERSEINIILSGGGVLRKLEQIAGVSALLNVTRNKKVDFLSEAGARKLVNMSRGRVTYDPPVVESLLKLTACHPYYIQMLCGELVSRCRNGQVGQAQLDELLDEWLPDQPEHYFNHLWGANTGVPSLMQTVYRHVLVVICQRKGPGDWTLQANINRPLQAASPFPVDPEIILQDLVEMETLEEDPQGPAYRMRIPLLEHWLLKNDSIARSAKEINRWTPPS